MTRILAGTSGYAYDAWEGPFYPGGLPAKQRLAFYASKLPAVEINNTFYRMPKPSVLEAWAGQVPRDFRFALKASQRITHHKRLRDAGDETAYLLRTAAVLGERLGAILFQLPPNLRADPDRLDAFLAHVPLGTRAAFEFRHPSWLEDGIVARLRERGCALVAADVDDAEPPALVPSASFGYVRLRRAAYSAEALAEWVARLRAQAAWGEAFVFLKHEDAGTGPRLAAELLALAERTAPARVRPARRISRSEAG
jgi:uncharacterized protein YecE (DUF72 family)